jgi:hypothetical protein
LQNASPNIMSSLQEQISKFAEAADGLRDDVSNAELEELAKDIGNHAESIWQYHLLIAADAERLYAKAKEYSEAARLQKNKSDRCKEFLKYALKSNGFTKAKFGDIAISISEAKKAVAKRPATETDFYAYPELVKPSFSWKKPPSWQLWEELPDFVEPEFTWDVAQLKSEGKDELLDYEVTTRMTVKINRED